MLVVPDTNEFPGMVRLVPQRTSSKMTTPTSIPGIPDLPDLEEVSGIKLAVWIAALIMLITTISLVGSGSKKPLSRRILYTNATVVSLVATITYLAISVHQGSIHVERVCRDKNGHPRIEVFRQVFWVHYVAWTAAVPFLIANLGLISGLPGAHIATGALSGVFYGLTRLFASLSTTGEARWMWYSASVVALIVSIYVVSVHGRTAVLAKGAKPTQVYDGLAMLLLILAVADTVIWSISTGSRHMSVGHEVVSYAVVDVLMFWLANSTVIWASMGVSEMAAHLKGFWIEGAEVAPAGPIQLPDPEA